ncbi:hypothetical protein QJS04_geneDACA012705 [Acorus gramineus]|uniref:RRM domain-containing protein n=1 Tax=Acorus gramineus TaxID=55184 RepID=A0AAV9B5Z7_ACOGR|nr:hypothetical protein QJS04_geneDACA012705 [Acorus gramineus]
MGAMDLSVQVLNIPSKTTQEDLITFFSYCGSVDEIQLKRSNNGNQTQEALVTFRQPYARQTALLLNDATISGNRVRVLPVEILKTSPISNGSLVCIIILSIITTMSRKDSIFLCKITLFLNSLWMTIE